MDKFEKLVKEIMAEAEEEGMPVTRAEAETMAEQELGYKAMKHYEQKEPTKRKATEKVRKVDNDKKVILEKVAETLKEIGFEPTMENEVALHFGEYTLKLTRHRPPKK